MEFVLSNLVENAAEHNTGPEQRVEVTLDSADGEAVVTVRDDGPGVPDHELAVLDRREETSLEHGSGIGLWVVQWVTDNTGVSVTFDTGPDGTKATVRVPTVGAARHR